MTASLRALLAGVIDYAGLYPPAELPLDVAFANYLRFRADPDAWMLGRFVIGAARLAELAPFREQIAALPKPCAFTVLGRGGANAATLLDGFAADLRDLAAFRDLHQVHAVADQYEVRLPEATVVAGGLPIVLLEIKERLSSVQSPPLSLFFESALAATQEELLAATLDRLHKVNQLFLDERSPGWGGAGFKLRCGGKEAVPSIEQVAMFLRGCQMAEIPLKLTAGLHHPLPRRDPATGAVCHGFLNILVADALTRVDYLSNEIVAELLADTDAGNFGLSDDHIRWRNLTATAGPGESLGRGQVVAFGSCSFDEPRDDLRQHGWL